MAHRKTKSPLAVPAGFRVLGSYLRNYGNVLRLGAFLTLGHGKFYALTLFEVAEAITGNGAEVYKHIRTTFAGDETETLSAIEPFDGTLDSFSHDLDLLSIQISVNRNSKSERAYMPPTSELHCLTNP
jgi:hypothetical protein